MTEIPTTVENYRLRRPEYEELADRVDGILLEVLDLEKINFALTDFRAKTIESFQERVNDSKEDKKPRYDLAGNRVVGYVRSDVEKIVKLIHDTFDVDEKKSKDKASLLKPDQFGYRAIHLICTLPVQRTVLPEYKKFKGMYFEIQVKTILEHAWAQIEHDRNYKYKALPEDIQRDFYRLSSVLEQTDMNFAQVSKRIEDYGKSIKQKTSQGKLEEIEVNPATLKQYVKDRFGSKLISLGYGDDGTGKVDIEELHSMNIQNLSQLEKIIPENFVEIIEAFLLQNPGKTKLNLTGFVFSTLMLAFGQKAKELFTKTRKFNDESFQEFLNYFEKAKQKALSNKS